MAQRKAATVKAGEDRPVRVLVRGLAAENYPKNGVFDEETVGQHVGKYWADGYRIHSVLNMGMARGTAYGLPEETMVVVLAFILTKQ